MALKRSVEQRNSAKRQLYLDAVEFIAFNDGPGDSDAEDPHAVRYLTTVVMVAHVFNQTPKRVARDVVALRVSALRHGGGYGP